MFSLPGLLREGIIALNEGTKQWDDLPDTTQLITIQN